MELLVVAQAFVAVSGTAVAGIMLSQERWGLAFLNAALATWNLLACIANIC